MKYEVFTSVLTNQATQAEIAQRYGVDRSTIKKICTTAKQGALEALAAAKPGKKAQSPEAIELEEAKTRIARLEKTLAEQAMQLHLLEGKDGWD
ncbi:hypothetical protein GCM10011359_31370 [Nesterenkonia alkaliphila]|nr:hypothetical protein GCM10011359_31370 [Nesterenkonia alkaliphila]